MKKTIYIDYSDDCDDDDFQTEENADSRSASRSGKFKNSFKKRRDIERYFEKRHLKQLVSEIYHDNDVHYDSLFD